MSQYDPLDALDAAQEELEERCFELWCEAVERAYKLAYVEQLRRYRGERTTTLDGRMMHPFSEQLGRAMQLEAFFPELSMLELAPLAVLDEARRDARREFVEQEAKRYGIG